MTSPAHPDVIPPYALPLGRGISMSMRRYFVDQFFFGHRQDFANAKHILDVGGVKTDKRGQFDMAQHARQITVVNISAEKGADIICDAANLPFPDHHFDVAIAAELLEHVPTPEIILNEIARVLAPGGRAYITAPFLFPVHADPADYRRFTASCWDLMVQQAGLSVVEIVPQGTFWTVFTDMLRMLIYRKVSWKYLRYGLYVPVRFLLGAAHRREQRATVRQDAFYGSFTTGYAIVAEKPKL